MSQRREITEQQGVSYIIFLDYYSFDKKNDRLCRANHQTTNSRSTGIEPEPSVQKPVTSYSGRLHGWLLWISWRYFGHSQQLRRSWPHVATRTLQTDAIISVKMMCRNSIGSHYHDPRDVETPAVSTDCSQLMTFVPRLCDEAISSFLHVPVTPNTRRTNSCGQFWNTGYRCPLAWSQL